MTRERQLIAFSIHHAINDGSLAVVLAALPVMRLALDLSLIQIGTILSAGLLATVVMQFVFGFLADRGVTRASLVAGLAAIAIMNLIFTQAVSYLQVLLFYVLLRAAAGVYHPVSFSTIFRTMENRAASMGFQSAFGDASWAFAMFSTGFLAQGFGWRLPFLGWGVAACVGVGFFIILTKNARRTRSVHFESSNRQTTRRYLALQFTAGLLQCIYAVFTGFMPLFLNINLGLSPGLSALMVALWLAVGVIASFNAGRIVEFLKSEHRTLRIAFALCTLAFALVLVSSSMNLLTATLIFLIVSGPPYFLTFPVLYGLVGTAADRRHLGMAYATNLSLSLLAGAAISYGAGYLASIYSLAVILPLLLLSAIGASLATLLL